MARQDTKTPGTPGTKKGVSTSSPTGSPSGKPVTTGKTHPACRAQPSRPTPSSSRNVTGRLDTRQPAKPLIYMALGTSPPRDTRFGSSKDAEILSGSCDNRI